MNQDVEITGHLTGQLGFSEYSAFSKVIVNKTDITDIYTTLDTPITEFHITNNEALQRVNIGEGGSLKVLNVSNNPLLT